MLDLDSDQWSELQDAYGPSGGIPALLRQVYPAAVKVTEDEKEPWFSLWSALCHQSDVYPASYAAVPHLVAAAAQFPPADRTEHLLLAGAIESMRHKPTSQAIPQDLEPAYVEALRTARKLTLETIPTVADGDWFRHLLAALAAVSGFPELAAAITDLAPEIDCPSCGSSFAAPGYDSFE